MTFEVFGFGSLVNRLTLPACRAARTHTAHGLKRAWRATSRGANGGLCSLSVVTDGAAAIEGLILTFDDAAWPIIRAREHNYDPVPLDDAPGVIVFRAKPAVDRFGDADHPIHLSYIDATLQGFLREFGVEGGRRFMATTLGWQVPILNDRHAPNYPRAQRLSEAERSEVDRLLESVDAAPARAQEGRCA